MRPGRPALALATALIIALVLSYAYGAVFVYYPISLTVSPTQNPVKLEAGSNAGQPDISGTIVVTHGPNKASLTITIHPTYQHNYYYDPAQAKNDGTQTYYVTIRVTQALTLPAGSSAKLVIVDHATGNTLGTVNLLATGDTAISTPLGSNAQWRIDIYVFIPEGVPLPPSTTATIQFIYTPETNAPTPPTVPP